MFTEHIWFIYNYIHRRTVSRVFTPDRSCLSYWVVYVHSFNTLIYQILKSFSCSRWLTCDNYTGESSHLVIMTLEIFTLLWLETREGLKLRLNWGEWRLEKNKNERGPPLVGSLGSLCHGTRDFCLPWLHALNGPVQIIFSLTLHFTFSIPLSPSLSMLGQAAVLGRLSLSMCLWTFLYAPSGVVDCTVTTTSVSYVSWMFLTREMTPRCRCHL